jgi:hypothetical protein
MAKVNKNKEQKIGTPHLFRSVNPFEEDPYRETGKCAVCFNPNAKHLNKVYPSGTIALYYGLKSEAFVCADCIKKVETPLEKMVKENRKIGTSMFYTSQRGLKK